MRPVLSLLAASALLVACAVPGRAEEPADLAGKARAVLEAHCFRCHGQGGTAKGGFGHVLERDRLVARDRILPGNAAESPLFQRIAQGEMPPKEQKKRPSTEEIALLRQWIEAGAPTVAAVAGPRSFLGEADVRRLVLDDLKQCTPTQRRFFRYFTLANLYNAGLGEEDLETTRQAVAKLLNSLSWHPRIGRPRAFGPGETVVRIDLRDYQWSGRIWERLVGLYPYRVFYPGPETKQLTELSGSEVAILRGDWFVATAIRPPVYYDLLQLPFTDRELERQLRVDVLKDIDEETAVRAGFNDSGVSRNNRILERHHAAAGAYWRTYDFSENTDEQNIFDHPLGPVPGRKSFRHAGGEIIFHLPNGLQGYFLVDRDGRRLDRAATEIVSDPKRPDKVVEAGVSCVSCHFGGFLPKTDRVRAHVEKNAAAFSRADVDTARALYVPEASFRALVDEDNERYRKALKKAGVREGEPEPITTAVHRYEGTLDLPEAAAELGLTTDDFTRRLQAAPALARTLGALRVRGGNVPREAYLAALPEVVRTFRLAEEAASGTAATEIAVQPFRGHNGAVTCVAFSPDGQRAVSGGEDGTLRLWDVATGRELKRFEGRAQAVTAVAFSPDGRQLVSGQERALRLWDVDTGRELRQFLGHADVVRCVAFSGDGRRLASGGRDRSVRLWDAATGQEVRSFAGHEGWVNAVAFSPDGRRLVSGSHDRTARLWDVDSGRELRRLEGHSREVHSVAFTADGKRVATGGNERTARVWDTESGKETQRFEVEEGAVVAVAFTADGRRLFAGASRRRTTAATTLRAWDVAGGKDVGRFVGEPVESIDCVVFTADGRALTGGADGGLRIWKLAE